MLLLLLHHIFFDGLKPIENLWCVKLPSRVFDNAIATERALVIKMLFQAFEQFEMEVQH